MVKNSVSIMIHLAKYRFKACKIWPDK